MPKTQRHPWQTFNQPPLIAALALGFSSLLSQLILLREFTATLAGNELVIGGFLATSLLLTGLGAWLGTFATLRDHLGLAALLAALVPLPPLQVAAIRLLRAWLAAGAVPSLAHICISAAAVLLPACLLSGLLFAVAATSGQATGGQGKVYALETLGAVVGAVTYTIATLFYTPIFAMACMPACANALGAAIVLSQSGFRRMALAVITAAAFLVTAVNLTNPARVTLVDSFPGQQIVREINSPYANFLLTRSEQQFNIFANGLPLFSSGSTIDAERTVHFAMAQRPHATHVLVFGGLAGGALTEVLKYSVERVDDVELDSALVALAREARGEIRDQRLNIIIDDPRRYVRNCGGRYEAIILAGADPSTAASNRLYTVEFFTGLKKLLARGGVVSFTIEGSENYRGLESRELNRALFSSLRAVFPNVIVLPVGQLVFVGSAGPLSVDVVPVLEANGIETSYVNRAYLQHELTEERIKKLNGELLEPGSINHDLEPSVYRLYLRRWIAELGSSSVWLAAALLVTAFLSIRKSLSGPGGPVRLAILTSGFASLTLEFCLLLAFQMIHGSLFLQIGALVGAFMLGNALGAAWAASRGREARLLLAGAETAIAIAAPLGVVALVTVSDTQAASPPGTIAFSLVLCLVGFLTGAEFPIAASILTRTVPQATAGLYAADLAGAAIGAATAGVVLVPRFGILRVCALVAAIKCCSLAVILASQGRVERTILREEGAGLRSTSLFLLAISILLIVAPGTEMGIYSFSFTRSYRFLLLATLFLGLSLTVRLRPHATGPTRPRGWMAAHLRRLAVSQAGRLCNLLFFSLATFYPLVRCYFQIPYLFCHACPRVCVFGYLRPFWVPAAALMNLGSYSWCRQMCPIGALVEPTKHRRRHLSRRGRRLAHTLRLAILVFVVYSYFAMPAGAANESPLSTDLYSMLFKNAYSVSFLVLLVMGGLLLLQRWVPRSFCNLVCPIGASCDLMHGLLRRIPPGGQPPGKFWPEDDESC